MAGEEHSERLDLSGVVDGRVRSVLRRLGVETVEKLLSLREAELSPLKNCGSKTIVRIMKLQKEHSKGPLFVKLQVVGQFEK
jgi:DNA-directed RNA polymerase alpha subunit